MTTSLLTLMLMSISNILGKVINLEIGQKISASRSSKAVNIAGNWLVRERRTNLKFKISADKDGEWRTNLKFKISADKVGEWRTNLSKIQKVLENGDVLWCATVKSSTNIKWTNHVHISLTVNMISNSRKICLDASPSFLFFFYQNHSKLLASRFLKQ